MYSRVKKYIHSQQFSPNAIGLFFNPFYFARKELRRHIASLAPQVNGQLLDIGCGTKPYKSLFNKVSRYDGIEVDTTANRARNIADFYYDGSTLPFENNQYDAVVSSQVLEHVFKPEQFLNEIRRVLKPGGKALLTVPFVWDEHEQPFDFARYSSFGLADLLTRNGFEILVQKKTNADARLIFQLINAYFYKVLRTRYGSINAFLTFVVMGPINVIGTIVSAILPANPDLYLDQVVLIRSNKT